MHVRSIWKIEIIIWKCSPNYDINKYTGYDIQMSRSIYMTVI